MLLSVSIETSTRVGAGHEAHSLVLQIETYCVVPSYSRYYTTDSLYYKNVSRMFSSFELEDRTFWLMRIRSLPVEPV